MVGKVAYIMSRFPHLPETFILREMVALEKLGWSIDLFPLILQKQDVIHQQAIPWLDRAHRTPWFSIEILLTNINEFVNRPWLYLSLWKQVLFENFRNLRFLIRAILLFPKAVFIAKIVRDENIVHIHAHYATHPALVAWIVNQLTGITYSITVHAHDIFVDNSMLSTKLRNAVQIVAISEYNKMYLIKILGSWIGDKTTIIHCGVDSNYYSLNNHRSKKNELFEIFSVGSLQPYKGYQYLIQACALLRDRGIQFRCRIVGGGNSYPELSNLINKNDLFGTVKLLGPKKEDDIANMLSEADCYVQPSVVTSSGKMEGIPVALMEAMVSGLPVVASSLSGIPELVKDGETGWLVPPRNAQMLAEAILQVYDNPTECLRRSQAARRLVLEEFELHTNVQKLSRLFYQIVAA
jgi:glycosyltransferase involved in cell wall biosynthesis